MNDLNQKKRIIYIVIALLILGALGYLAYRFLLPVLIVRPGQPGQEPVSGGVPGFPTIPGAEPTPGAGEPTTPSGLPPGAEQRLTRLTDFPVISPGLNKTGDKIFYYQKEGGDLFQQNFDATGQEKITNLTVVGLVEALWSPAGDRSAVFYLDQESLKGFLHINASTTAALPENVKSFSWSPDGKSLAYAVERSRRLALTIGDQSGRNGRAVFTTPLLDASIRWTSADRIAFQTAPSGVAEGFVFVYSRAAGSFTRALGPLFGLMANWSPDGTRALVSSTNAAGKNLALALHDAAGKQTARLEFQTLASKCAWLDAKEFFCAVPRLIPASTVLPDEYLSGEFNSSDQIVRVEAASGKIEVVFDEENFDISNLVADKNKKYLFFTNRLDGTLWSYKLGE